MKSLIQIWQIVDMSSSMKSNQSKWIGRNRHSDKKQVDLCMVEFLIPWKHKAFVDKPNKFDNIS